MAPPPTPAPHERRTPPENFYAHSGRQFDAREGLYVVKIFSGDCYVTPARDEMLVTILGSCVAACVRDPLAGVGGMNHFLLPGDDGGSLHLAAGDAARYGVHAMERLINGILARGGKRDRLEVKLFGGGNVIESSAMIGSRNAEFARGFLRNEGLAIAAEHLGGDLPRRIHYYPATGRVKMRLLRRKENLRVVTEERRYRESLRVAPVEGAIELF
jgi:chemotaxis protein CheD